MRTKRLRKFRMKRIASFKRVLIIFAAIPVISVLLGYIVSIIVIPNLFTDAIK